MLYIIFLQQIHVVHVTVRFILLQLQLQAFRTPLHLSDSRILRTANAMQSMRNQRFKAFQTPKHIYVK